MKNLVIKGHATRGNEVIEILEMLGGKNSTKLVGSASSCGYYIDSDGNIAYHYDSSSYFNDAIRLTLEKFLEKYPYKVWDKVLYKHDDKIFFIRKMFWENDKILYELSDEVYSDGCSRPDTLIFDVDVVKLQPYKEETMDTVSKSVFDVNAQCCDISNKIIKKETMEKEISGAIINRFICLEGYDFYDDKGNIIDTKEITMKKKQPKYPKTYVECAKLLDCFGAAHIDGYKGELLDKFQELLICRDAYWKIAGEQMDLGEPWKPDWLNTEQDKFVLYTHNNVICLNSFVLGHNVLAFPTKEIRDAFLENFKNLIELCKELL